MGEMEMPDGTDSEDDPSMCVDDGRVRVERLEGDQGTRGGKSPAVPLRLEIGDWKERGRGVPNA
jgi:hypothetical protein